MMQLQSVFFLIILLAFSPFVSSKRQSPFEKDVTITLEQKDLLDKFKTRVIDRVPHDYMKRDIYLLKFLRAKQFDIPEAEKFLDQVLQWRKEENMDDIEKEDWTDLERNYRVSLESRDRFGQPILYLQLTGLSLRDAVVQGQEKRLMRYIDRTLESACTLVRKLGEKHRNITRGQLLLNVQGFNLIEHGCLRCISIVLRVPITFENHWPECVEKLFFVNTPQAAIPIVNSMRPLFNKATRESLQILGVNPRKNLETLLQYIDISEIPVQLGGQKTYRIFDEENEDYYND